MLRTVCVAFAMALRMASSTLVGLLPTISLSRYTWSLTVRPPSGRRTAAHLRTLARPRLRRPRSALPRGVHDHGDAGEADGRADQVEPIGPEPVEGHRPEQAADDEHPTIGGEHPAEGGIGLQGRHEAVAAQGDHAGARPQQAAVLPDALPDEPGTTDLGDRGEHEEQHGAGEGHGGEPAIPRAEPHVRIERTTARLQGECSTTELMGRCSAEATGTGSPGGPVLRPPACPRPGRPRRTAPDRCPAPGRPPASGRTRRDRAARARPGRPGGAARSTSARPAPAARRAPRRCAATRGGGRGWTAGSRAAAPGRRRSGWARPRGTRSPAPTPPAAPARAPGSRPAPAPSARYGPCPPSA